MWRTIIIEVYLYSQCLNALENLALGRPVWEGQPWEGKEDWRGDKAVDGLYDDRSAAGGQCVISENGRQTATWRVDLGGVVSISHIDIYFRTDNRPRPTAYTSRMAGFFLYVSNTTTKEDGHLCFHEIQRVNGRPSEDQRINCSVHGRYVIYYNERLPNVTYPSYYSRFAHYELCELEVYGCRNGSNCNIPCPTNCQERRCDVKTGHCHGCVPGYVGPTCSQECPPGFYGIDCLYNCSQNCNVTRRCDRFTGKCEGGCKPGWTGATCYQTPLSCDNNDFCVLSIVVSVVIVLAGSVMNYVFWKKNAAQTSQKRHTEEFVTENVTLRQTTNPGDNSAQYTELQEVGKPNTYEDLHTYSN
uniref:Uncharacterized protein LOC111111421 isoform X2 n=1 Tax=Crassostrea virginica TaxID=6565 RepID=A0A8B8BME6_CRAVI|nr:uncharacterized protein LOC111111421 isoform X2 [Crassostrea virginica]